MARPGPSVTDWLSRAAVTFVGALALVIGALSPFINTPADILAAWSWVLAVIYVTLGASLVWLGLWGHTARVQALVTENPRLLWGALVTAPPLLLLGGSWLANYPLSGSLTAVLALGLIAGAAILFWELP